MLMVTKDEMDAVHRMVELIPQLTAALKSGRAALGVAVDAAGGDQGTHTLCQQMDAALAKAKEGGWRE